MKNIKNKTNPPSAQAETRRRELCSEVSRLLGGSDGSDAITASVQAALRQNPHVTAEECAEALRDAAADWAAE